MAYHCKDVKQWCDVVVQGCDVAFEQIELVALLCSIVTKGILNSNV